MTKRSKPKRTDFRFWGCSVIQESVGLKADGERELLELLETAPAESIYHHSIHSVLRRTYVPTPYTNDFASWVLTEVRDPVLAERMALPSPFAFADLEAFRQELLRILDDRLSTLAFNPRVLMGKPFYFLRGHLVGVPLDLHARTLEELYQGLSEVDESSIYFHAVEAIGRLEKLEGDFETWVRDALGLPDLASRLRDLDPFVGTLHGYRQLLRTEIRSFLVAGAGA